MIAAIARRLLLASFCALALAVPTSLPPVAAPASGASTPLQATMHAAIPQILRGFELNRGQADPAVRFLTRAGGYSLFLTNRGAEIAPAATQGRGSPITLQPAGANPHVRLEGVHRLPGVVNYYLGSDPSRWHTAIPTYAAVQYRNVYHRINLIFRDSPGGVEYDWLLRPGARAADIHLNVDGPGTLRIDSRGNLRLHSSLGDIVQAVPHSYQVVGGVRRAIAGRFQLQGPRRVGIVLGPHDTRRPVVIDPRLLYNTFLGGGGQEVGQGVAVDGKGSIYVAGYTESARFPGARAPEHRVNANYSDGFVVRLDPTGRKMLYSTYLGGSDADVIYSLAVDQARTVHLTGYVDSANFPTSKDAIQPHLNGLEDAFYTRLNAKGALTYSSYLGGKFSDRAANIVLDTHNNAYIAGTTSSPDFPVTPNAVQSTQNSTLFVTFLVKLHATGVGSIEYGTYLPEFAFGVGVDPAGNMYVGVDRLIDSTRGYDIEVRRLTPSGAASGSVTFGGTGDDFGSNIAVDAGGNVYVVGNTSAKDFQVKKAIQPHVGGSQDAFVAKVNIDSGIAFSTYLGGSGDDRANAVAVDHTGAIYITGWSRSFNFPVQAATQSAYSGGTCGTGSNPIPCADAILTKLSPDGSRLLFSTYLGDDQSDAAIGMTVDARGNAFITGGSFSSHFPLTAHAVQSAYGGQEDAFVAVYGTASSWPAHCKKGKVARGGVCVIKK